MRAEPRAGPLDIGPHPGRSPQRPANRTRPGEETLEPGPGTDANTQPVDPDRDHEPRRRDENVDDTANVAPEASRPSPPRRTARATRADIASPRHAGHAPRARSPSTPQPRQTSRS